MNNPCLYTITVATVLLALCSTCCLSVRCYSCTGQCSPYSDPDSNTTVSDSCQSCKYVVAYGGFGDLAALDEVNMQICSNTTCASGTEESYSFQYMLNSYVYTMPAYATCCNADLCNLVGSGDRAVVSVVALFAGALSSWLLMIWHV